MKQTLEQLQEEHQRVTLENEMARLRAETAAIGVANFPGMHVEEPQDLRESWGDMVSQDEYPYSGWDGVPRRGNSLWNTLGAQLGDRNYGQDLILFQDEVEHARIRAIGRLLCDCSVNAKAAKENLTSYILGTGFTYKVVAQDGEKPSPKLIASVQSVVNEILRENKWAVNREEELFQRSRRDGEYFAALFHVGGGHSQIRILEPEQITEPDDPRKVVEYYELPDRPYCWSFGICTDDDDMERVHGYHARWQTNEGRETARFLFPSQISHCKLNVDSNIKRGVSDYYAIYETLVDAGKLLRNTTKGHAVMSAIAFIREHATGVTQSQAETMRATKAWSRYDQPTRTEGVRTRYTHHYSPGTIVDVPIGQQYKPSPMANQGVGQAMVAVEEAALRVAASNWCMPGFMLSGDLGGAAYSSVLAIESPFVKYCQRGQKLHSHHFVDILWKALRIAWQAGRFDHLAIAWEDLQELLNIHVELPIIQSRDRNIETNRHKILWDSGIIADETWAAEEGYDHEQEVKRGAKVHQQPSPFGGGDSPGFPADGKPVGKAEGSLRDSRLQEVWDESKHPRGDDGRWINKEEIVAARSDPKKAEELRQRVTEPEQRKKLENAIGGEAKGNKTISRISDEPNSQPGSVARQYVDGKVSNHPLYAKLKKTIQRYYPDDEFDPSLLMAHSPFSASRNVRNRISNMQKQIASDLQLPLRSSEGYRGVLFDYDIVASQLGGRKSKEVSPFESRLHQAAALLWENYPGVGSVGCSTKLTEHHGPGDHPSGSPQDVHAIKGGEAKFQKIKKEKGEVAAKAAIKRETEQEKAIGADKAGVSEYKQFDTNNADRWGRKHYGGIAYDPEEARMLGIYQVIAHEQINSELRHGKLSSDVAGAVKHIDNAMERLAVPEDVVAYRGISLRGDNAKKYREHLGKLNAGDVILSKAYVSTSLDSKVSKRFAGDQGVVMEIRVPKGAKGLYMDAVAGNRDEQELLLNRGTKLRLVDRKKAGQHLVFEVAT